MSAVSFQQVSKTYRTSRGELTALQNVSFDIEEGDTLVFTGFRRGYGVAGRDEFYLRDIKIMSASVPGFLSWLGENYEADEQHQSPR
jgi:ABC-type methionine transport system ATPase subunit